MANNVAAYTQEKYSREVQALLEEALLSMELGNSSLASQMPNGSRIHYPRPTYSNVTSYTKYTDATISTVESSDEYLDIDQVPMITFEYDHIDEQDNVWEVTANEAARNAFRIKEHIDGKFFAQYVNALNVYNSGTAVALSSTNAVQTFLDAFASLGNNGVDTSNVALVVDEFAVSKIGQNAISSAFTLSDSSFKDGIYSAQKRGFKGTLAGTQLYASNNLTCIGSLAMATQPTANDTVTYNGVVFKFVASIGTTAGNVLLGADAAAAQANLIAALNGAAGAGTTYVEVSKADRSKLAGLTASASSTTVVLTSNRGFRPVSRSMTAAGNKFGQFVLHALMMEKGAIHIVLRDNVMTKVEDIQRQLGKRYFTWSRFGLKVFSDGAERMIRIPLEARAAE